MAGRLWACPITNDECFACDGICSKILEAAKGQDKLAAKNKRQERAKAAAQKLLGYAPKEEPEVTAAKAEAPVTHQVNVIRDHKVEYPQLFLEVFFSQMSAESEFSEMFARAGCRLATSMAKADLVVFPGGADVNPKLYGEDPHQNTRFNDTLDRLEMQIAVDAMKLGIPMVGVCRGAQLLHVLHKGKLYQDVDGHGRVHWMNDHRKNDFYQRIPSTHHQMVIPNDAMEVIASSTGVSKHRWENGVTRVGSQKDVEAYFYKSTCTLGVQGHPEYKGFPRYTAWFLKLIEELILHNSDVYSVNNNYRFKPKTLVEIK